MKELTTATEIVRKLRLAVVPKSGAGTGRSDRLSPSPASTASGGGLRKEPSLVTAKKGVRSPGSNRKVLDDADYRVWFGTNRKLDYVKDGTPVFSNSRGTENQYGYCRVFIPKSHKIGSTGSTWWERFKSGADDRLKIIATRRMAEARYWKSISSRLARLEPDDRAAVIFVHGYNVSFENAALRAAQIGFDLSIKGAMAFFSWPSQGHFKRYSADEATIEASEPFITEFIEDFVTRSGARSVNIIAHSMGNRGVLRAINRIASKAQRHTGALLGQIILAAADVDADTFRNLSHAYRQVAQRTTLYVSSKDLAVEASRWLHNFPRAGLLPPIMIAQGIDTINVTNADLTKLGHGYVANCRGVLEDMHRLLIHDAPPDRRFGLRPAETETGERYWEIGR
jgi:esterase/lipase superfamily enzyme